MRVEVATPFRSKPQLVLAEHIKPFPHRLTVVLQKPTMLKLNTKNCIIVNIHNYTSFMYKTRTITKISGSDFTS